MRRFVLVAVAALAAAVTLGQYRADSQETGAPAQQDQFARGKYIAHHVAMCVECHSPRDENGKLIESKLFKGAPMPVAAPPYPGIDWAFQAPDIAGLVGYDDEAKLLMTGIVPRTGKAPRRPMPSFQMTQEDAEAVVAYLKSLR